MTENYDFQEEELFDEQIRCADNSRASAMEDGVSPYDIATSLVKEMYKYV